MNQIKTLLTVLKAFFKTENRLAEEYLAEQEVMYKQWFAEAADATALIQATTEAHKDPKVTVLTPSVKRRALMYRSQKRNKRGAKK